MCSTACLAGSQLVLSRVSLFLWFPSRVALGSFPNLGGHALGHVKGALGSFPNPFAL